MNTTPSGTRVVLARGELDHAAARRDPHHVAGLDAELRDRAARELRDRRRLERIEHGGAPRHRAGVPMLELAAGGEDERDTRRPALSSGGVSFAATSLPKPPGRGKPWSNTTSRPGLSGASVG